VADKVAFIDTETTGFIAPIVPLEIAILTPEPGRPPDDMGECFEYVARFNPGKDIEYGAVAAHGILPDDVFDCPPWSSYRPAVPDYVVGHAVDYDLGAVFGEGQVPTSIRRIDTLALSRYAYPDEDSHKLAAMMYIIFGQNTRTRDLVHGSHSALVDARNTATIFKQLMAHFEVDTWEGAWRLSEMARVPRFMTFGKYGPQKRGTKGAPIEEVRKDKGYVKWLLNLDDLDPYLRKALT
jgi:exodeoxyribonuclease X